MIVIAKRRAVQERQATTIRVPYSLSPRGWRSWCWWLLHEAWGTFATGTMYYIMQCNLIKPGYIITYHFHAFLSTNHPFQKKNFVNRVEPIMLTMYPISSELAMHWLQYLCKSTWKIKINPFKFNTIMLPYSFTHEFVVYIFLHLNAS